MKPLAHLTATLLVTALFLAFGEDLNVDLTFSL